MIGAVHTLPRRHQAPLPSVRPVARLSRLGVAAQSVSIVRGRAGVRALPAPDAAGAAVRADPHLRPAVRAAGRRRSRNPLRRSATCCATRSACRPGSSFASRAGRCASTRRAATSIRPRPTSSPGRAAGARRRGRRSITTRPIATRSSSAARFDRRRGWTAAAGGAGRLADRADVDPLARGVEVRRARVPLLPARSRPRDRRRPHRRGAGRLARAHAAGVVARRHRGAHRHRSRRGLRRRRARGARRACWRDRRPRDAAGRRSATQSATLLRRRGAQRTLDRPREPAERRPRAVDVHRRDRRGDAGSRPSASAPSRRFPSNRPSDPIDRPATRSRRSPARRAHPAAPQRRGVRRPIVDRRGGVLRACCRA